MCLFSEISILTIWSDRGIEFFDDFNTIIMNYNNYNFFAEAHSLPNYKHAIINTPDVLDI